MRKQLLSVFLPLLATMLVAAAETQSTGNEASKRVTFQKVDVVRTETGINVEITARGQVTPKLSALDRPDRLVVDLPNTVMASSRSHVIVEGDLVKGIRIGMDAQTRPTTRIVIDLAQSARYELVPGNENKVVLKLAPAVSAKATKAPVNAIAAADDSQPRPSGNSGLKRQPRNDDHFAPGSFVYAGRSAPAAQP